MTIAVLEGIEIFMFIVANDKKVPMFNHRLKRLVTLSLGLCIFVLIASLAISFRAGFGLFIVWNVFLGGLPLLMVFLFHKSKNIVLRVIFFLSWLFVFPNSPYMITDLIHLEAFTFYKRGVGFLPDLLPWFALVGLTLAILISCVLGYSSLHYMHRQVLTAKGSQWSWGFVGVVSLLSGIAIYIGRFMRFNSWDMVTRPIYLLKSIFHSLNPNMFLLSLLFAFMTFITFLIFQLVTHDSAPLSIEDSCTIDNI